MAIRAKRAVKIGETASVADAVSKTDDLLRPRLEPGTYMVVDGQRKKIGKASRYIIDMLTLDDHK